MVVLVVRRTVCWCIRTRAVLVATSIQSGERLNVVSTLPRLLAVVWAVYYAHRLQSAGQRSKATSFPAAGLSMAIVSTATTTTAELGTSEKKND